MTSSNSKLIAAAPDLLAACKAAFNFIDDVKIQKQVIAAIERAEDDCPVHGCTCESESAIAVTEKLVQLSPKAAKKVTKTKLGDGSIFLLFR